MEDNPSYGMAQRNYTVQQPAAENVYELVASGTQTAKREYVGQVESPVFVPGERRSKTRRSPRVCIAIVALTAVLALLVAIAGVVLNPVLNSKQEVERLQLNLNQTMATINELRDQISTLQINSQTQYSEFTFTIRYCCIINYRMFQLSKCMQERLQYLNLKIKCRQSRSNSGRSTC